MEKRRFIEMLMVVSVIGGSYFLAHLAFFRSPTKLEATLEDDRTQLSLYLLENENFEIVERSMMGEKTFKGRYRLQGSHLIFLPSPYENEIIPDTVTILGDKIILRTDWKGEPSVEYSNYFQIQKNDIKNVL